MTALRILAPSAQAPIAAPAFRLDVFCTTPAAIPQRLMNPSLARRGRIPRYRPRVLAMPTGVVKWFNETKGFGFIKPDDGGSDVFAHYSGIKSKGFRTLKENQRVEYQVQQGQKGPQAVEIVPLA
jgi:CspA family cold shock protein